MLRCEPNYDILRTPCGNVRGQDSPGSRTGGSGDEIRYDCEFESRKSYRVGGAERLAGLSQRSDRMKPLFYFRRLLRLIGDLLLPGANFDFPDTSTKFPVF